MHDHVEFVRFLQSVLRCGWGMMMMIYIEEIVLMTRGLRCAFRFSSFPSLFHVRFVSMDDLFYLSLTFCYFNSITSSGRALSSVVSSIFAFSYFTPPSSNYAARITFRSNLSASQPFSRPAARTHLNLSPHRHPLRVVPQEYVSAHAPHPLF